MTDRYTKIALSLIALFLGIMTAVQLGSVTPAHAVSINVAVDQIIDALRKDHHHLTKLIQDECE